MNIAGQSVRAALFNFGHKPHGAHSAYRSHETHRSYWPHKKTLQNSLFY